MPQLVSAKSPELNKQLSIGFNTAAQHNLLVRYPMRMGLYEARIFALMLRCLHSDMKDIPPVIRISVKDVVGQEKPAGNIYPLITKACRSLYAKSLNLLPLGMNKIENMKETRIVQDCEHIKGTGYIEGTFSNKIATYLLQLKDKGNFTVGEIEQLMQLRNANSHRVYWYLKSWDGKADFSVPIEEFRNIILGDAAEKYKQYGQFKRAILVPVMAELEAVGFHVEFKELHHGKSVAGLKFTYVKAKKGLKKAAVAAEPSLKFTPEVVSGNVDHKKLWDRIVGLGLSEHQTGLVLKAANPESADDYKAVHKVCYDIYVYQKMEKVANPGAVAYARFKEKYKLG